MSIPSVHQTTNLGPCDHDDNDDDDDVVVGDDDDDDERLHADDAIDEEDEGNQQGNIGKRLFVFRNYHWLWCCADHYTVVVKMMIDEINEAVDEDDEH